MDIQHEGNQTADCQKHSATPPEDLITSMQDKMVKFQRQAETEKPNLGQMPKADGELSCLLSMKDLIDKKCKNNQRQKKRESELVSSLESQVSLSKQESDEMREKYNSEAVKLSESMSIIHDLLKDKEDLSRRLRESQNELLVEKAKHLHSNEALEAKIESLKLTNQNLISELNDAKNQLSLGEEPWQKKYADLDRSYQMKMEKSIQSCREAAQSTQIVLDNKFKTELNRTYSLLSQLNTACNKCTLLEDSHKLLIDARQPLVDENNSLKEERTLLEEICLTLKKKCLGKFGRKMQGREFELKKMKRKMREAQALMQTVTQTETELLGGTTGNTDDPGPRASYSLRERLKYLDDGTP